MILFMVILGCMWLMCISTLILFMFGVNWTLAIVISFVLTMFIAEKCDKELLRLRNNKEE